MLESQFLHYLIIRKIQYKMSIQNIALGTKATWLPWQHSIGLHIQFRVWSWVLHHLTPAFVFKQRTDAFASDRLYFKGTHINQDLDVTLISLCILLLWNRLQWKLCFNRSNNGILSLKKFKCQGAERVSACLTCSFSPCIQALAWEVTASEDSLTNLESEPAHPFIGKRNF